MQELRIHSIFDSIDGEVNHFGQGSFTTFIRLAGCNLRCKWCDTKYAQQEGNNTQYLLPGTVSEYLTKRKKTLKKLTITGGEPLIQEDKLLLLFLSRELRGIPKTVETNGTYPIPHWRNAFQKLFFVVDIKLPSSGVDLTKQEFPMDEILKEARPGDIIKFVIQDTEDYKMAREFMEFLVEKHNMGFLRFAFSPLHGEMSPRILLAWMQDLKVGVTQYNVLLNLQLHKILNLVEDC